MVGFWWVVVGAFQWLGVRAVREWVQLYGKKYIGMFKNRLAYKSKVAPGSDRGSNRLLSALTLKWCFVRFVLVLTIGTF